MRYRKLDPNGDYSFGNGQLDFYIDIPEAVGQAVETTLRLFVGEWYLDTSAGTPYPEQILGKHSQDQANVAFSSVITQVQGVVSLNNFQSTIDPETRNYSSLTGVLDTIYGQTELQIENETNF